MVSSWLAPRPRPLLAQPGVRLPERPHQPDALDVALLANLDVAAPLQRLEGVVELALVAADLLQRCGLLRLVVAGRPGLQQRLADLLHPWPQRGQWVGVGAAFARGVARRRQQLHLDRSADPGVDDDLGDLAE